MWDKIDLPINTPQKYFDLFDVADRDYISYREGYGKRRRKPIDFELHLAIHILPREKLPLELLEPLKQWARENKTLVLKP